jgi:hypothetical protein
VHEVAGPHMFPLETAVVLQQDLRFAAQRWNNGRTVRVIG